MAKWQKGISGNPKGRPPILLPELQREADQNRNLFKKLVIQYLNMTEEEIQSRQQSNGIPFVEKLLGQVLERTANDGDIFRFRAILEMVFGKIPEEREPFEISEDEKAIIQEYRRRISGTIEMEKDE